MDGLCRFAPLEIRNPKELLAVSGARRFGLLISNFPPVPNFPPSLTARGDTKYGSWRRKMP